MQACSCKAVIQVLVLVSVILNNSATWINLLTIDPIQQTALQQMKKNPHYDTVLLFQIKLAFSVTVDAK